MKNPLQIFTNNWMDRLLNTAFINKLAAALGVPTFDNGSGKQVIYMEETLSLLAVGDFTSGSLKIVRFGSSVTISAKDDIIFPSASGPSTGAGFLPSWATPSHFASNLSIAVTSNFITRIDIEANGAFQILFFDSSFALAAETNTSTVSAAYTI